MIKIITLTKQLMLITTGLEILGYAEGVEVAKEDSRMILKEAID